MRLRLWSTGAGSARPRRELGQGVAGRSSRRVARVLCRHRVATWVERRVAVITGRRVDAGAARRAVLSCSGRRVTSRSRRHELHPCRGDHTGSGVQVVEGVSRSGAEQLKHPAAERDRLAAHEGTATAGGLGRQVVPDAGAAEAGRHVDHGLPQAVRASGPGVGPVRLHPGGNPGFGRAHGQDVAKRSSRRRQRPPVVPLQERHQFDVVDLARIRGFVGVVLRRQPRIWRICVTNALWRVAQVLRDSNLARAPGRLAAPFRAPPALRHLEGSATPPAVSPRYRRDVHRSSAARDVSPPGAGDVTR